MDVLHVAMPILVSLAKPDGLFHLTLLRLDSDKSQRNFAKNAWLTVIPVNLKSCVILAKKDSSKLQNNPVFPSHNNRELRTCVRLVLLKDAKVVTMMFVLLAFLLNTQLKLNQKLLNVRIAREDANCAQTKKFAASVMTNSSLLDLLAKLASRDVPPAKLISTINVPSAKLDGQSRKFLQLFKTFFNNNQGNLLYASSAQLTVSSASPPTPVLSAPLDGN